MKNQSQQVQKESDWLRQKCRPCEGGTAPMAEAEVGEHLRRLPGWEYTGGEVAKTFAFKNYDETVAFVNAVAWVARREDHHPTIEFGYKTCRIRFSTHAIQGISTNDFISAAKVDALLD